MSDTLTLIEKTAFMKSIPILSAIPTEALAELATRSREIACEPDQVLFERGDPNRGSFLVISGTLQVRRGDALIRVLQSGMAFGELWLMQGEPHTYTLTALDNAHVLNITPEDVYEAIQDFPDFGAGMVRSLSLRVHELTSRMLDLEKVIARLDLELTRNGIERPQLPPSTTEIPIRRGDLFGGLGDAPGIFEDRPSAAPGAPPDTPRSGGSSGR